MPSDYAWSKASTPFGWLVALIVMIAALMLGFMGLLPKEAVLIVAAVCSIRL